ncbi:MAG: OmpH family outer membrane protein [Syntrophales bacterium]|nr:OmpH family outer membrane protein [Syntrophales bacterium]
MRKNIFLTFTLILCFMTTPAMAAKAVKAAKDTTGKGVQIGQTKIGIIDMQRIIRESKVANAARAKFQKEMAEKDAQLTAKMKDVQKQEEELTRLDPNTPEATRRQKTEKLKFSGRELNNLRQDLQEEVKRKDMEMARNFYSEILQIIQGFAMKERYAIIVDRINVVTAEESLDITDKIIKLYDAQKK